MPFTRMDASAPDDWRLIDEKVREYQRDLGPRIMDMLRQLASMTTGFRVHQLEHGLQTATRAERAGAEREMVVAALCHDMAKTVSILNHAAIAAEIMRPFVSDDVYRVIYHHTEFQARWFAAHVGLGDPNGRERFRDEPWFALAERFTDEWDQTAFDPAFESKPLSYFEPMVLAQFARPKPR